MKKSTRFSTFLLTVVIFITAAVPVAFAGKDFAPRFDTNVGMQTQYAYSENNVSWLRKLVIKEDMLSVSGIANQAVLNPVTNYPYTSDAPHFKAEVEECVKTYTLDEESQKAAYLYLLQQIGALTVMTEPDMSNQTKAEWLRANGIIVTPEDEATAEKVLMISALYAMMRNDLYYVYKGEHLEIPQGTPLEEALVKYIAALSGNDKSLAAFMVKFFGGDNLGSLEDYIYYTSLMSLYVNGFVSVSEIKTVERKEVFRRVAIMTIKQYGISIDGEKATQQELTDKYLTAMLGTQYKVSLDPQSLIKARGNQSIPYYILQRMAQQDSNVTISNTRYSYEECFDIVLRKTDRFNLKKEFYSDVYEYDVFLDAKRSNISINPTPLKADSTITINGASIIAGKYAKIDLLEKAKQTITIVCTHSVNNIKTVSTYKINVHQGIEEPSDSNITGIIPTLGSSSPSDPRDPILIPGYDVTIQGTLPPAAPIISGFNNVIGNVLSVNSQGQLVDQNNNIVGQGSYEQLPEGYKYVVGEDGLIQVVFAEDTTIAQTPSDNGKLSEDDAKNLVSLVSLVLCILLVIALICVLMFTKKGGKKKNDIDKVKARRAKEKAKKAKAERKLAKKQKNN